MCIFYCETWLQRCSVRPSNKKADFTLNLKLWRTKRVNTLNTCILWDASSSVYSFLYTLILRDTAVGMNKSFVSLLFSSEHKQNNLVCRAILQSSRAPIEPLRRTPPLGNAFGVKGLGVVSTQLRFWCKLGVNSCALHTCATSALEMCLCRS